MLRWERDDEHYNPYDQLEEALERDGMPAKKIKFISRYCRNL